VNEGRESLAEYTARGGVVTRLEPVELELDAAIERAKSKRPPELGRRHPGRAIGSKFPTRRAISRRGSREAATQALGREHAMEGARFEGHQHTLAGHTHMARGWHPRELQPHAHPPRRGAEPMRHHARMAVDNLRSIRHRRTWSGRCHDGLWALKHLLRLCRLPTPRAIDYAIVKTRARMQS
jgi:hypothetical protein